MNLFDRFFQKKEDDFSSDNKQLLKLIRIYWKDHQNMDKWKDVYDEIYSNRPVLWIPVVNRFNNKPRIWMKSEHDLLDIAVVSVDGFKAVGAFTEEHELIRWTKDKFNSVAIRSGDLMKAIETSEIDRVIINNKLDDWFFLNRSFDHIKNHKLKANATVTLWTPVKTPPQLFMDDLCDSFDKLGTVKEIYFCGHTIEKNHTYVFAIKLFIDTENARKAIINTFQRVKVKHNQEFDLPVDLDFIAPESSNEEYYIKQNSLIYKKALN